MTELLRDGGPMIGVILIVSTAAWLLLAWEWLRLRAETGAGFARAAEAAKALELGEAAVPARLGTETTFPERLVAAARRGGPASPEIVGRRLAPHLQREGEALARPLEWIAALAASLPLLGLLGTVLGMIRSFDALTLGDDVAVEALAGGVSQALLTTQTGLVAAVPVLLLHGVLRFRIERARARAALLARRLERALGRDPRSPR